METLISTIWMIIILAFWLIVILFGIVASQMLFTTVDSTIIAVLVPSVFGIITYWLTKTNERKMYYIKYAREDNYKAYNEYVSYLLKIANSQVYDLEKFLEQNSQIILIASTNTVTRINKLVVAFSKEEHELIGTCIENVVKSIRADLGYDDRLLKKSAVLAIVAEVKANEIRNKTTN